jgi:transcription termination factor NusB
MGNGESKPVQKPVPMSAQTTQKFTDDSSMLDQKEISAAADKVAKDLADRLQEKTRELNSCIQKHKDAVAKLKELRR